MGAGGSLYIYNMYIYIYEPSVYIVCIYCSKILILQVQFPSRRDESWMTSAGSAGDDFLSVDGCLGGVS